MTLTRCAGLFLAALLAGGGAAGAEEFRLDEVTFLNQAGIAQLKPGIIAFTDHRKDELADPVSGLMRFEDWARTRPVQKQFLSLYPGYVEPTVATTVGGVTKPAVEKLRMYVAEARFLLNRPAASVNLARYAALP